MDQSAGLFKRAIEELSSGRADVVLSPFVVTLDDLDKAEFSVPITDLK
jgi:ABC-type amino acid transport substrate-binding protein